MQTSIHITIAKHETDVHVDRSGFVVNREGYTHWDLNNLLRHMTVDLAGDKLPWVLGSATYVNKQNRPLFQATLSPWIGVDLPSPNGLNRTAFKVGLAITGSFGGK